MLTPTSDPPTRSLDETPVRPGGVAQQADIPGTRQQDLSRGRDAEAVNQLQPLRPPGAEAADAGAIRSHVVGA